MRQNDECGSGGGGDIEYLNSYAASQGDPSRVASVTFCSTVSKFGGYGWHHWCDIYGLSVLRCRRIFGVKARVGGRISEHGLNEQRSISET